MNNWKNKFTEWGDIGSIKIFPPVSSELIENASTSIGDFPYYLKQFFMETNGIVAGALTILPIEDFTNKKSLKRTWDSIQKANDLNKTKFLPSSLHLLKDFIIFSNLGMGYAGLINRNDGKIWFEDSGCIRETSFSLEDFIFEFIRLDR